jgi:hypothetical protein
MYGYLLLVAGLLGVTVLYKFGYGRGILGWFSSNPADAVANLFGMPILLAIIHHDGGNGSPLSKLSELV